MVEIKKLNPTTFELQTYEPQDEKLISSSSIDTEFISLESSIEFFVYDLNNNIISENYNYVRYRVEADGKAASSQPLPKISEFNISPNEDLTTLGFDSGEYIAYYNFLTNQIGDSNTPLFISEISSDRTEVRLDNTNGLSIPLETNGFINFRDKQDYFVDFYLNFGNNNLVISNNIKLDNENTDNPTILIKLYEPLPLQFDLKSTLWVVTTLNEPEAFLVTYPLETIEFSDSTQIQGPNFDIPLKGQINNSSQNLSYTDILKSASTSSQNQIESLLAESSINISVDYTDFNNFINFSSAQTRIENFIYKVGLIETYTSQSNILKNVSSSNASRILEENKISKVIKNFDKFEYFMYYSSGSIISYPKSTTEPPYTLMSTGSAEVLTWLGSTNENSSNFGGLLLSASNYDNANPDQLKKAIPEYLREDPDNQQYDLFVDMVAQYYDSVWLYTKDITQKYNADNRLDFGVSKDLVSDAIKDFGVKLYQNNFSNQELYTAFLGMTPEDSLFPFPEITGSLPAPTGFEFVDTLISASNDVISMDDTNKSLYKKIYHNIPYLLKSKGTTAGLRALITSYGIPDTILKISEFGGKDKVNANDYDLYFNNFNYAYKVGPTVNNFSSPFIINNKWNADNDKPKTIQFRFKAEEITSAISPYGLTNLSQCLLTLTPSTGPSLDLILEYTKSGLSKDPYLGAPINPNYQFGELKLIPNTSSPSTSTKITLPFFDGGWWSVMLTFNPSTGKLELSTGNKIYNGNDGTSLGFYEKTNILSSTPYLNSNTLSLSQTSTQPAFSGSLQEVRYYKPIISQSVFKDYIMNPLSFEGNGINSAPDQLVFRAALGSELDINTSSSIHPKVTGSWIATSSFSSDSNFSSTTIPSYSKNIETFFLDQPAVGIKNRITDKIRSENDTLPSGNTLSPIRSLSQTTEASASYTDNVNYLEVAFSPQNQINDDIIGQMGHFNIGEYIGDPAQRFSGNIYPDLNNLSEDYFKKYIKQYNLTDFVRLIKFFDNSLFKMIKDFIPTRTSLASGIVIKQHLLERNKYPQPQVSTLDESKILGSVTSHKVWNTASQSTEMSSSLIESFSGGAAGVFNKFNTTTTSPSGSLGQGPNNQLNITQSWSVTTPTLSGSVTYIHDSQAEFYNGELSGSNMLITNGELNPHCEIFKNPNFTPTNYKIRMYNEEDGFTSEKFLNPLNQPTDGYIQTFYGEPPPNPLAPLPGNR